MIWSNFLFSRWDRIFEDPMTTAAVTDGVAHHAIILELTATSQSAKEGREQCRGLALG